MYSSALNTSLFVSRDLFLIFHSWLHNDTLAPVRTKSSLDPSVQKVISPGLWVYLLTSNVRSYLSIAKEAMPCWNGSGSSRSVCSVAEVVLMLVSSATIHTSLCPSVALPLPARWNHSSSPSSSSVVSTSSSPSRSVTQRMSLVGCDLEAASNLHLYLCC